MPRKQKSSPRTSVLADFVRESLRDYCERYELSQADLSKALERYGRVTYGTVQAIINHSRSCGGKNQYNPSLPVLEAVAQSYYELTGDEGFKKQYNKLLVKEHSLR